MTQPLTPTELDLIAHALGWPDTRGYRATRGPVRWRNPCRNRFVAGGSDDAVWCGLAERGLAVRVGVSFELCGVPYRATTAGMDAARAVLRPIYSARTKR